MATQAGTNVTLQAVLKYLERGWWSVPIPFRQKGPTIKGWQRLRITAQDAPRYFNGTTPRNNGVILGPDSDNLIDVDLDCPEALAVAAALLPATACFGRTSTPGAHRLYRASFPAGTKAVLTFDDPVKLRSDARAARLLELRIGGDDKGAQTVFPPSTHESGELIAWVRDASRKPPADIDGATLAALCGRVAAAAALLTRYWPPKGNRHDLSLALGGVLARNGWEVSAIEAFVGAVVHAADDPRQADRVRCARDAAEAVADDKPAYGFPKLKEVVGDAVAGKLGDWLGFGGGRSAAGHHGPVIRLTADITAVAEAAERAIAGAGLPLLRRDTMLVRPVILDARGAGDQPVKTVGLMPITAIMARSYMEQAARFEKYDNRAKTWTHAKPPTDAAELILARAGHWPFPTVRGVLAAPSLRSDGSVLDQPGLDPATGMYLIGSLALPDIPEHPTKADGEAALTLLDGLLDGFPWQGDDDARAVGLSALISPVVRAALPTVPLHAISAPERGTGKSFLTDLASAIATGFCCPAAAIGRNEEELEKRLVAAVLDGQPLLALDNISRSLGGDFLCQLLDRPLLKVRVLGQSYGPKVEPRLILFATGNNLTLTGDINRRVIIAHMDAGLEEPWHRQFNDNPLRRIMSARGHYVAAAITVCRAFMTANETPPAPLASFAAWSNIVRSALLWLGCGDPVRTMASTTADDPERQAFAAVLDVWSAIFGEDEVTVAELAKRANERDSTDNYANADLREALMTVAAAKGGGIDNHRLGNWLRRHQDRRLGRRMLRRAGVATHPGVVRWQVTASK